MSEQLFKPGEEVVCLKEDWVITPHYQKPKYPVPQKDEIYTVDRYWPTPTNGKWYFNLRQFPSDYWFHEKSFARIMPSSALANELAEIFQNEKIFAQYRDEDHRFFKSKTLIK